MDVILANSSLRALPFSMSFLDTPGWRLFRMGFSNSFLNVG